MDRPILFSTPMIQAILDGRKSMTRRVVKPPKWSEAIHAGVDFPCPHGIPGDRLWVREAWAYATDFGNATDYIFYKASYINGGPYDDVKRWRPSIFMPRSASRITLEITDVKVERLQEITNNDALYEGTPDLRTPENNWDMRRCFQSLWDSINGKTYPWTMNPFVWVIEFKRI